MTGLRSGNAPVGLAPAERKIDRLRRHRRPKTAPPCQLDWQEAQFGSEYRRPSTFPAPPCRLARQEAKFVGERQTGLSVVRERSANAGPGGATANLFTCHMKWQGPVVGGTLYSLPNFFTCRASRQGPRGRRGGERKRSSRSIAQ